MSFRAFRAAIAAGLMLIPAGPAFAQQFSDGYEFLKAVRDGDGTKVTSMLNDPGQSIVNTKDRSTGEAALHIVTSKADLIYMRFILQHEANPDIQDGRGNTPLMVAVNENFLEGAQTLITYKANVNLPNASGETPLIRAVQLRNADMVTLLLKAGADPDRADLLAGFSARDYARQDRRSPRIAKLLDEAPKLKASTAAGPRL